MRARLEEKRKVRIEGGQPAVLKVTEAVGLPVRVGARAEQRQAHCVTRLRQVRVLSHLGVNDLRPSHSHSRRVIHPPDSTLFPFVLDYS
jgi:hypothetical protein